VNVIAIVKTMLTSFLLSFLFESSWLLRNGLAATESLDARD